MDSPPPGENDHNDNNEPPDPDGDDFPSSDSEAEYYEYQPVVAEDNMDLVVHTRAGTIQSIETRQVSIYRGQNNTGQTYDIGLPSQHSYLGGELECVRGRTVFEDGTELRLEILRQADVTIVPGWTLPLHVFDRTTTAMLRDCLRDSRTFGVLADWDFREVRPGSVGTTAELFEYVEDRGILKAKAKARQRFKILECDSQARRVKARVKILPEINLEDPLANCSLQVFNRLRSSLNHAQRLRRMDAAVTAWPLFVFEQYNEKRLVAEVKRAVADNNWASVQATECDTAEGGACLPDSATELSFWVAQNMPMESRHRMLLLSLNSPVQRLRWQLHALQQRHQVLTCAVCSSNVGFGSEVFSMSAEGAQGAYVNPSGHIHELITLHQVQNVSTYGQPSSQFSWFPGYKWICMRCDHCGQHMGWMFVTTNGRLNPKAFWGVCRKSVKVQMAELINLAEIKDKDDNTIVF